MAMQSVTERSIEITGMRSDTIDCTPAARRIQAVGGIGYPKYLNLIQQQIRPNFRAKISPIFRA